MGSCYSGDHVAEDNIHTVITTCNTEEPQEKCHLGTVSNRMPSCMKEYSLDAFLIFNTFQLLLFFTLVSQSKFSGHHLD